LKTLQARQVVRKEQELTASSLMYHASRNPNPPVSAEKTDQLFDRLLLHNPASSLSDLRCIVQRHFASIESISAKNKKTSKILKRFQSYEL